MTGHRKSVSSQRRTKSAFNAVSMFYEREPERYALHSSYMNEMMVRVLQTIGYDIGFPGGTGTDLFDRAGVRYLDLLSGWGVFGIGRNHPKLCENLACVLAANFPNLVQMDVSPLAGIPGERLLRYRGSGSNRTDSSIQIGPFPIVTLVANSPPADLGDATRSHPITTPTAPTIRQGDSRIAW